MTTSTVYLRDGTSGDLVEATLFDKVTPFHLDLWERDWIPAMQARRSGILFGSRPEDAHWDWRQKSQAIGGMLGYQSFAVTCQDELQGLMMLNDMASAKLGNQFGKPLIYALK